jgi:hypothetical protein
MSNALKAILDTINNAYENGECRINEDLERGERGDTLADFISIEVLEACQGNAEEGMVDIAINSMSRALEKLQDVIGALESMDEVSANTSKHKMKSFGVTLTDNAERKTSFSAGFDSEGTYFESESTIEGDEEGTHTVNVNIGDINIDGNGWRDIESGGHLQSFIEEVLLGNQDGQEFLDNISKALGVDDPAGIVF